MIFKVHWIIDGVAEIEADNKNDAENKIQNDLEEYVKSSDKLMNHFVAQSIQGTAYLPGSDEPKKRGIVLVIVLIKRIINLKMKIKIILSVLFFLQQFYRLLF